MANQIFPVKYNGSEILPVTDGAYYTDTISANPSQDAHVYMEFFSDANATIPVTPTGGTISVYGSPMGNNFISSEYNYEINAVDVQSPTSSYTPPVFLGRMVKGRIDFLGITGAQTARITFWRF